MFLKIMKLLSFEPVQEYYVIPFFNIKTCFSYSDSSLFVLLFENILFFDPVF